MAIRIEHYSKCDDFSLLGHTFHGIKDLEDYIELSVDEMSQTNKLATIFDK